MYMQARYYDPVIGWFYSNDPVRFRDVHSFNRYAYANNNPYKYTDPTGETPYLVSRPLSAQEAMNWSPLRLWPRHNFVVNNANSIGDPLADIISYDENDFGNMGRDYKDIRDADYEHWKSLANPKSGAAHREIMTSDSGIEWLVSTLQENNPYLAVPSLTNDSANSNSGAGALAHAGDGGPTHVPKGGWQPGHEQSSRVDIGRSPSVVRVSGRIESRKLDEQ
jgi:hypothetical protein